MSKFTLILIATVLLSYAISSARATECDCDVPMIFEPVCGDDKESYPNEMAITCMNQCEGTSVKMANEGPCKDDKFLLDDEE